MFADIVFPLNNEDEYVTMATRLGIKELAFCYQFVPKRDYSQIIDKIRKVRETTQIRLSFGLVARPADTMKARRLCDLLLVKASPENRLVLEKPEVDLIFELENGPRQDKMHYPNSGLNQVLAAVGMGNRIIAGFSFSMALNAEGERRAALLGRIRHNIRICRKYGPQAAFASFAKDPYEMRPGHDLRNLAISLGMHQAEAQEAIGSVAARLEENRLRKEGKYFGEGIEVVDNVLPPS